MEPEVREYLRRIALTILVALVWLAINATAAIKGDNAFIVGRVRTANVLFYIWFVISIVLLLLVYRRIWKKPIDGL